MTAFFLAGWLTYSARAAITAQFDLLLNKINVNRQIFFLFIFRLVDQFIFIWANLAQNNEEPVNQNATIQNVIPIWMVQCINLSIIIIRLFIWNFLHVLIMVISAGLSTHFKLINDKLEHAIHLSEQIVLSNQTGVNSILEVCFHLILKILLHTSSYCMCFHLLQRHYHEFWIRMRENYFKVCKFVEFVDDEIGPLILLSILNNLVFICTQLFNNLR